MVLVLHAHCCSRRLYTDKADSAIQSTLSSSGMASNDLTFGNNKGASEPL